MAITWKNLAAPNFAASNQLRIAANEQVSRGLEGLSTAASEQQDSNNQKVIDKINALGSVEEFDSMVDSGELSLDSLKQQGVQPDAIQKALAAKETGLKDQVLKDYEYKDKIGKQGDATKLRPLLNQFQAANTQEERVGLLKEMESLDLYDNTGLNNIKTAMKESIGTSFDNANQGQLAHDVELLDSRLKDVSIRPEIGTAFDGQSTGSVIDAWSAETDLKNSTWFWGAGTNEIKDIVASEEEAARKADTGTNKLYAADETVYNSNIVRHALDQMKKHGLLGTEISSKDFKAQLKKSRNLYERERNRDAVKAQLNREKNRRVSTYMSDKEKFIAEQLGYGNKNK